MLSTTTLRDVTLKFSVLSINAADLLVRFFRESTTHQMEYRSDINVTRLRLEYQERPRDAILAIMSGILKENPFIESFELVLTNSYNFLNVNNFIENFEEYQIGPNMRKLTLRDSFKFTEKTRFLDEGTKGIEELTINKTILNQRFFKLDESLRMLKLCPVNFACDVFEISFEQFVFVIDQL